MKPIRQVLVIKLSALVTRKPLSAISCWRALK